MVSALEALMEDARAGRLTATTPDDRWLLLRMDEALQDCDAIRQMAIHDHPGQPMFARVSTEPVSIRAAEVRALA